MYAGPETGHRKGVGGGKARRGPPGTPFVMCGATVWLQRAHQAAKQRLEWASGSLEGKARAREHPEATQKGNRITFGGRGPHKGPPNP